jgi:hypothetical protein
MTRSRNRAPRWFWIAAILLLLWGMMGVTAFYFDVAATEQQIAKLSAYDQALRASRPAWLVWVYGVAVWSSLAGAIVLLARSRFSRVLFSASLLLVVVMFGYIFATTDLIAVKGFATAAGFPLVILAIAIFQVWLSGVAARRGWIS